MRRFPKYLTNGGFRRRAYLAANAFELLIALLAIFSALAFFIYPDTGTRTAVGQVLHPWDWAWSAGYGVAGVFISYGLIRPWPRVELAGLWLLGAAIAINAVAVVSLAGSRAIFPLMTYVALVAACYVRGHAILTAGRDNSPIGEE